MKELFLNTENGRIAIEQQQIKKYNLKPGDTSPCNRYKIVDKNGNAKQKTAKNQNKRDYQEWISEDTQFTTSEILDIAEGTDSDI